MSVAFSPAELIRIPESADRKAPGASRLVIMPLTVLILAELFTLPFIIGDKGLVPNLGLLFVIMLLGVVNGAPLLLYLAVLRDQGEKKQSLNRSRVLIAGILFIGLVAIEIVCGNLSYFMLGWLGKIAMMLTVGLNLSVILFYWRGLRNAALVLALVIAILVIPHNLLLNQRMLALNEERDHVVTYINQVKADTGSYPNDLYEYKYQDWSLQDFFRIYTPQRYPTLGEPFSVGYCPIAREECTFGYWYSPTYGWTYSDD